MAKYLPWKTIKDNLWYPKRMFIMFSIDKKIPLLCWASKKDPTKIYKVNFGSKRGLREYATSKDRIMDIFEELKTF